MTKWEERYLSLAAEVAKWSKDPTTKVGAVVVGSNRRHIALGFNGFPQGIADDDRLNDRATKHLLTQHAERNCLDNAEFDVRGGILATTKHPCHECAKSIVSRGITTVISPSGDTEGLWAASSATAAAIFAEAGVTLLIRDGPMEG